MYTALLVQWVEYSLPDPSSIPKPGKEEFLQIFSSCTDEGRALSPRSQDPGSFPEPGEEKFLHIFSSCTDEPCL